MYNVQAIVLKQLLTTDNKAVAMDAISRLHKKYFNDSFSSIFAAIQNYQQKHGDVPNLDTLALSTNRSVRLSQALAVLKLTQVPDVPIQESITYLVNEFTQDLTLDLIEENVLKDITQLDSGEIIERVNSLAGIIEDEVGTASAIETASSFILFPEHGSGNIFVPFGISDFFDQYAGGLTPGEVLYLGGYRGSGKSITCSNIQVKHHIMGTIDPYFTLEMPGNQIFARNMAILSGVSASRMRKGTLEPEEVEQLLRTRGRLHDGGIDLVEKFLRKYKVQKVSDAFELESELITLEEITPMPIIYDPKLTIPRLKAHVRTLRSKYGEERLGTIVLDYLNQVMQEGVKESDRFDWTPQMAVAKEFKEACVELEMPGVSPYQIDKSGEARMSKGILDACDIALILNPARIPNQEGKPEGERDFSGAIQYESTKVRNLDPCVFTQPINWENLVIDNTKTLSKEEVMCEIGAEFALSFGDKPKKEKNSSRKQSDTVAPSVPKGAQDL